MFRCSVDQGGSGIQVFALLIRTVVVYYTQVSQVRIEGTELRKRYGKKEMKKMCHLLLSGKKDSFVSLSGSKPARTSSCGSRVLYGVIAFPTYMAHDFEMFTAAGLQPVQS